MAVVTITVADFLSAGSAYSPTDDVVLVDTAANIAGLTPAQVADLSAFNVDTIDASDDGLYLSVAQLNNLGGVALTAGDTPALRDTRASIEALTGTQLANFAALGIMVLDASDDFLVLDIDQVTNLGGMTFAAGDTVVLSDSGANISGLSAGLIGTLAAAGLSSITATDVNLTFSTAQFLALGAISLEVDNNITVSDTGANISAMSVVQISSLSSKNIDTLSASDGSLALTVAQFNALGSVALVEGNTVTLQDTSANLAALTAGEISALAGAGVDVLLATNGSLALNVAQYQALGTVLLTEANIVTLADSGATIAALSAGEIGDLATDLIDAIDALDDTLDLSVAQYSALGGVTLTDGDTVTLVDTGSALAGLDSTAIGGLAADNVDALDASDNMLVLSLAQVNALNGVTLASDDLVTVLDTTASLEALVPADFTALVSLNVDEISSTTGILSLTVDQLAAFGTLKVAASNTVTLSDTGAAITVMLAADIAALSVKGVDSINVSDNALSLNVEQALALGSVGFDASDVVTIVDSAANLQTLTATNITALADLGIDALASTDGTLALDVAQYSALAASSMSLTTSDTVTLLDAGSAIAGLDSSAFAQLDTNGIDIIDANDDALSLTVAQYEALGPVTLTGGDIVTLADTGTELSALTSIEIGNLAGDGIDILDVTVGGLTLDLDKFNALGMVALTEADEVTVETSFLAAIDDLVFTPAKIAEMAAAHVDFLFSTDPNLQLNAAQAVQMGAMAIAESNHGILGDTAAAIEALSATEIAALAARNFDLISADGNPLALTVEQIQALNGVSLFSGDIVTVTDTAANIQALDSTAISGLAGLLVDGIKSLDGTLTLTAAQFSALGTVTLDAADTVTLSDTGVNLAALDIAALDGKNVDVLSASDTDLNLSAAQATALGNVTIDSATNATVVDTGTNIQGMSETEISALAASGIDAIDSSTNAFAFSLAQYNALGTVALTGADTVTITDAKATLEALNATQITALDAAGIDILNTTEDAITLTVSQATALADITLAVEDDAAVEDSGATIGALSNTAIEALDDAGIDRIDATDNVLTLSVAQYLALGGIELTQADVITLADTNENIALLDATAFDGLKAAGIDSIDVTDGTLTLSVAQFRNLNGVLLTDSDTVVLSDTAANLETLTSTEIGNLAGLFVDKLDAGTDPINLDVAQATALGPVTVETTGSAKVVDSAVNIQGMTTTQIAALAGAGFDEISATDTNVTLSGLQVAALGTVVMDSDNYVTLQDTNDYLSGLTSVEVAELAASGIDEIDSSDNFLILSLAAYRALGTVSLNSGDSNTINDTGAALSGLTLSEISGLSGAFVHILASKSGVFALSVEKLNALGAVAVTETSNFVLTDSQANIEALTDTYIGGLAALEVDSIDSLDNVLNLTVAQANALGTVTLTAGDMVTVVDTATAIDGLTEANILALDAAGVDKIDAGGGAFALTLAEYNALGNVALTQADDVALADSSANLAALDAAAIGGLSADGIDTIDVSDNALTLSVAEALALGTVTFAADDVVTVLDTAAAIQGLDVGQIGAFDTAGIDILDSTEGAFNLTVAQVRALGGIVAAGSDTVTLLDIGGNIASLSSTEIAALAGAGIDRIDASNVVLSLSVAQLHALGTVTLTSSDSISLSDTSANIAALSVAQISALSGLKVDLINATDDVLELSLAQFNAIGTVGINSGDNMTILDTGANLAGLTPAQIGALEGKGVDTFKASDGILDLTVAQFNVLGGVDLVAENTVTLKDTGAALASLNASNIAGLEAAYVDALDATDNVLDLTVDQATALGAVTIAADDLVTIKDTGAAIAAMSSSEIGALSASGIDAIDASDDVFSMTVEQATSLNGVLIDASDTATIFDTGAAIAGMSQAQIAALETSGFTSIDASDDALSLSLAQIGALGTVTLTETDTVTVVDTAAALAALTLTDIANLKTAQVDILKSSDGTLALTVEQFNALAPIELTDTDIVTLTDTAANLEALSVTEIQALGTAGIDALDATDNVLSLSVDKLNALGAVELTDADEVTLLDNGATLGALTAGAIAALEAAGVDVIDSDTDEITLTIQQYQSLGAVELTQLDNVTLADSNENIALLSALAIEGLAADGIDVLKSTDPVLSLTVAQYEALGTVELVDADYVELDDTSANLEAMSDTLIAGLTAKGIDGIRADDATLNFSVSQATALNAVSILGTAVVSVVDSGAAIGAMTATEITALTGAGFDAIDADNDILTLDLAQFDALGSVTLTGGDAVTLKDTNANIGALSDGQINGLSAAGIDFLESSEADLTLSLGQYFSLGTVELVAGDNVIIADSSANLQGLNTTQISELSGNLVDELRALDGQLFLLVDQVNALGTVTISAASNAVLRDTGAEIGGMLVAELEALEGAGIQTIEVTDTNLTLDAAQVVALGTVTIDTNAVVTLADTGTAISALDATALAGLAATGVDTIDATSGVISFTKAQLFALGTVSLTPVDDVTLLDTAANIEAMIVGEFSALAGLGVDDISAGGNAVSISVDQVDALGVPFNPADTVSVADTAANIAAMSQSLVSKLAMVGVDHVEPTDGVLNVGVAFATSLGTVTIVSLNDVILTDTVSALSAMTVAEIGDLAGSGFSHIDSTNDVLSLDLSQFAALGTVVPVDGDTVTIYDTSANLSALLPSEIADLNTAGVDILEASEGTLALNVAQALQLGSIVLEMDNTNTLADLASNIQALTASQIAGLAGHGFDIINATDGALNLSVGQYRALGTVSLTGSNNVTLVDTEANLDGLTLTEFGNLSSNGVDFLDSSNNSLLLTVAEFNALGSVQLTAGDVVTLRDTGAAIAAMTSGQIAALKAANVDVLDATDNKLTLNYAQFSALGGVNLTNADVVTLRDTAANLGSLTPTQLGSLIGVDIVDSSDGTVSLNIDQALSLDGLVIAGTTVATLADTAANLQALTPAQLATLNGIGMDLIDTDGDILTLSVAQAVALDGMSVVSEDAVTLSDTAINIQGMTDAQIGALAASGIDTIDSTDDTLTLTAAQAAALGAVTLHASDFALLEDTGANIAMLAPTTIAALNVSGLDRIAASDTGLNLTVAQFEALGSIALTDANTVVLVDSGANLGAMTAAEIAGLEGLAVDALDASDNVLVLNVAQYNSLGAVELALDDMITLRDTEANLDTLGLVGIAALAGDGIDVIDSLDDALSLTVAEYQALGTTSLTVEDTVTLEDVAANIQALLAGEIGALAGKGIDIIDATDTALSLRVDQFEALGTVALTAADTVTLSDTAANLLAIADLSALAALEVDALYATDGNLNLTFAQIEALGTVTADSIAEVVLADGSMTIQNLSLVQLGALAAAGVDRIDATDNLTYLTKAQVDALGAVALTADDTNFLKDTALNIGMLTPSEIVALQGKGIDTIASADIGAAFSVSIAQYDALGTITLNASDTVTLVDTGAALAALTETQLSGLAGNEIDAIDASDNVLSLTVAKLNALGTVSLTGDDVVTLLDTGANIAALTVGEIAALEGLGVDIIDVSDGALALTYAQFDALGAVALTDADTVTLVDTGSNLTALNATQIGALEGAGIDALDSSTDAMAITLEEFNALGAVTLETTDEVTLTATGSALGGLTSTFIGGLAAAGIDILDAEDDVLTLDLSQYNALGGVELTEADEVTLADTGAALGGLTETEIAALGTSGVDIIDATDNSLTLSVAQYLALGTTALSEDDTVTISDTATNIQSMTVTQLAGLAGAGVSFITTGGAQLTLSIAQAGALGTVSVAIGDLAVVSDTSSSLSALTTVEIAALGVSGIDRLDATDDMVSFNVAQAAALMNAGISIDYTDTATLVDLGANIQALSPTDFTELRETTGIDVIDASDDILELTLAQFNSITGAWGMALPNAEHIVLPAPEDMSLTQADVITLKDSSVALAGLSGIQIEALADAGIDHIDVIENALTWTLEQANALGTVTFASDDVVTVVGAEADFSALSVSQIAALEAAGVDVFDASDDLQTLSVAQYRALGTISFGTGDVVTIADTGAALATLTTGEISLLSAAGVSELDATDGALDLSVLQATALGSVVVDSEDTVTVVDNSAALGSLTAAQIAGLGSSGIDTLDATDGSVSFSVDAALALAEADITIEAADTATILDLGALISGLPVTHLTDLVAVGFDKLDAIDNTLSLNVEQYNYITGDGGLTLSQMDEVTLADTAAAFAMLDATAIGGLEAAGIDRLDVTENILTLDVLKAKSLGAVVFAANDVVTISDAGYVFAELTPTEIAAFGTAGIDTFDSSDNSLVLNVAQYLALGSLSLSSDDDVTIFDVAANIQNMTVAQIAGLEAAGVSAVTSNGQDIYLSVDQATALGAVTVGAGVTAIVADTAAALSALTTTQIAGLGTSGLERIDSTENAVSFSVAQGTALFAAGLVIDGGDVATLLDMGVHLADMSISEIQDLKQAGFDIVDASDDELSLSINQYQAITGYSGAMVSAKSDAMALPSGMSLTQTDTVTLADTGAALGMLGSMDISGLEAAGVDIIDAIDDVLSLSVAQYQALGAVELTADDVVTLADSGSQLAGLSVTQISALGGDHIDVLDATDDVLALSIEQFNALGSVTLTGGDTVTLVDTGANLAALTVSAISALQAAGVDALDASDDVLVLSLDQYNALGTVALTGDDTVTLADTGATLAALTATEIGGLEAAGIDALDVSDGVISLTVAQATALGAVTVAGDDDVTVSDTGAAIAAMTSTQIAALAAAGVDKINATDGALSLTVAQYLALGSVALTGANTVTLADTGANLAALSVAQIGALEAAGVDGLDATDDVLSLSLAQFGALASVTLAAGDDVSIVDTGAALAALTVSELAALGAAGVDVLDATDDEINLSVTQVLALDTLVVADGDTATLVDRGEDIAALSVAQLAALETYNIDAIDAEDDNLSLTVAQLAALGTVALSASDTVTLADTGSNLAAMSVSQIGALAASGVSEIDASDNSLALSVAQFQALGTVQLSAGDLVTLEDTGVNISAMTVAEVAALSAGNVDTIDATDDLVELTAAQTIALGSVSIAPADMGVLVDTGANIGAMTAVQIGALSGFGIDRIDASDDVLSLSIAQLNSLGPVALSGGDTVTLQDTGAALSAMTTGEIAALAGLGVDALDATDGELTLTLAQFNSLGAVALSDADVVTLLDTGATLSAMSVSELAALEGAGVDALDASDDALTLTLAQIDALGAVSLTAGDTVTIADTGAGLSALSATEISALATLGVDVFDATDDQITLSAAQAVALGAILIATGDDATVSDTAANIQALTAAQLAAFVGGGIDGLDASDDALVFSFDQYAATSGMEFDATDSLTVEGTSGDDVFSSANVAVSFKGLEGNDELNGSALGDTLNGGAGADTLNGGDGNDIADYSDSSAGVTVRLWNGTGTGGDAEGDILSSIEGITGAVHNDVLIGATNSADLLDGAAGNDYMNGLSGNDTLIGGDGDDILVGGAGADVLDGGAGFDIADYAGSALGVTVKLWNGTGAGGDAEGDTLTGIEGVVGSSMRDVLVGAVGVNNKLEGRGGNDFINGLSGDDTLYGGADNDTLIGGAGADSLDGGAGSDAVEYLASTSGVTVRLWNGTGSGGDAEGDTLTGIETVTGSNFNDSLVGAASVADYLKGAAGRDYLLGLSGDDTLDGGDGDDVLYGGAGADYLIGGAGIDRADYSTSTAGGVTIRLWNGTGTGGDAQGDTLGGIEDVTGTSFNDVIIGSNNVANRLVGGAGNDYIDALSGDDILVGGAGADSLYGGTGNDTVEYIQSTAGVTIRLWNGTGVGGDAQGDVLGGIENVRGSAFNDFLIGSTNQANFLRGEGGNDYLNGLSGADRLDGGVGFDTLIGGAGNDVFVFGTGYEGDIVQEFEDGADTVDLIGGLTYADLTVTSISGGVRATITASPTDYIDLMGVAIGDIDSFDFI